MTYRLRSRLLALLSLSVVFAGCKHKATGPAVTISVSIDKPVLSIVQGGEDVLTATITQSDDITGSVSVRIDGAPAGVTGTISNVSTTGLVTHATLTINVASSTVPGPYTITVRASGTGIADAVTSLSLTVTGAPAFSVSLDASTLSLAQGANSPILVTVGRVNFTAAVALTAEGLPNGATAAFNPASVSGTATSIMTLTLGAAVLPGQYTVTVRGTSLPLTSQTATLTLTVTSNVAVDFSACAPADRAIWLAFQNGSGPWTRITGVADVYRFTVTSATGGFAFAQSTASSSVVNVQFYSQGELTAATLRPCTAAAAGITVNGSFAHTNHGIAFAFFGGRSAFLPGDGPFQLSGVPAGQFDLLAYTGDNRGFITRALTPTNGGTFGTIDFTSTGPSAFDALEEEATVSNAAGGEALSMSERYFTGTAPNACIPVPLNSLDNFGSDFTLFGVPPVKQLATDFYQVFIQGTVGTTPVRSVSESFHDLATRVVTPFVLPTLAPTPVVTVTTGTTNYKRLTAVETALQPEYNGVVTLSYSNSTTVVKTVIVSATAAYRAGATFTLATPDLSPAGGWLDSWAPAPGDVVTFAFTAAGSSGSACTQGARQISTTIKGTR